MQQPQLQVRSLFSFENLQIIYSSGLVFCLPSCMYKPCNILKITANRLFFKPVLNKTKIEIAIILACMQFQLGLRGFAFYLKTAIITEVDLRQCRCFSFSQFKTTFYHQLSYRFLIITKSSHIPWICQMFVPSFKHRTLHTIKALVSLLVTAVLSLITVQYLMR